MESPFNVVLMTVLFSSRLTNRKWFSFVCTLIDNNIRITVVSRVRLQQILTTVMTNVIVNKSTDNAEPLSICFLPQYSMPKKVISERDQNHDTKKEQAYNFLAI